MTANTTAAAGCDLLEGLADKERDRVLALGEKVTAKSGAVLFTLGEEADRLYILEAGQVNLALPMTVRGTEKDVLVEEKNRGEMLGWSALVPPHKFTLTAKVAVDAELLVLPRGKLGDLINNDARIGHLLMRNLATLVGQRLVKTQTMWVREIQRAVDSRFGGR
ncbi:MAG: cyclic nucleotide-binding domain-containing protein [Deltaproteobacteria bacterium]|nr:cyclic nucleotide-binding domain-containing protein [Deltaproteobacteria bacterium]